MPDTQLMDSTTITDEVNERIDYTRTTLDARIDKLNDKIDELRDNKPITMKICEKLCLASAIALTA